MLAGPQNPSDGGAWSQAGREQPSGAPSIPSPASPVVDEAWPPGDPRQAAFDAGFLLGVLVGEGHFGGDGRQPQVTLRMHADHAALFGWLMERHPGSRLYGPYDHGGRRYYQWMARGRFLRDGLLPILRRHLRPEHSGRVWGRYEAMVERYGLTGVEPGSPPGPDPSVLAARHAR